MKKEKLFLSILILVLLVITQATSVFAAPALEGGNFIRGTVQAITLETDTSTGVTTVLVTLLGKKNESQTVRISLETAQDSDLGLVTMNENGPLINEDALGLEIKIDSAVVISNEEEAQDPMGNALATFFSDIPGLDYETIMSAHEDGTGFGVIAQMLWLTRKLGGNSEDFLIILHAKKSGDFSGITLADGSTPLNWGQFRKAVMDGDKKGNLGVVISNRAMDNGNPGNQGNNNDHGTNKNKNKDKDKGDNNNGNGNGNGNPNRP